MYITLQDQPDGSLHMPSRSLVSDKTLSQSQPLPVHADSNHETLEKTKRKLNVTSVHLDHPSISTMMAARLATSLISHILFLKNQVPLYVPSDIFPAHTVCTNFDMPQDQLYSCRACLLAILNLARSGGALNLSPPWIPYPLISRRHLWLYQQLFVKRMLQILRPIKTKG